MFLAKIITKILSSKIFVRLYFGIDASKSKIKFQTGYSTILMIKALKKYASPSSRILDIGTGPIAVHAIWSKKNIGCDVAAAEINYSYVENARIIAKSNNSGIDIIKSDLFKNVKDIESFDIILFNPPVESKHDDKSYIIAERFLKEAPNARLMMVVNRLYVDFKKIEKLIRDSNYTIKDIVTSKFNPARVYVLRVLKKLT